MGTTCDVRFNLPGRTGNPFDYEANDIQVHFAGPANATRTVPAFFDGGTLWRARLTVAAQAGWRVTRITHNSKPQTLKPAVQWVSQPQQQVRRKGTGFVYDDSTPYYPIGHNAAWRTSTLDIPDIFAKMGRVGENWSRVWMCHWGGTNLDWDQKDETLSLEVARYWDHIVAAAEKARIHLQLVLQHHGPYSATVNSNWAENPWNTRNGGFLSAPEEFFTDPIAIQRTKRKLRYTVARWGASPAILAWELFNEVEWTEGARKTPKAVEAWHREMASFLRLHDSHQHLLTTSSHLEGGDLYAEVDYLQPHAYPPDLAVAALSLKPTLKPIFYGEIGPAGDLKSDDGRHLKAALWASLFSEASGAAQYWTWDHIDQRNLYPLYAPATRLAREMALAQLPPVRVSVRTPEGGTVSAGPGKGWASATRTEFPIQADGQIEGIGEMPSFLQGDKHREMFPRAEFPVNLLAAGTFSVLVQTAAKAGGKLAVLVDGKRVIEKTYPEAARDSRINEYITIPVPGGAHRIVLENRGTDWVALGQLTVTPVGASVQALAKANSTRAALWLRRTAPGPHPGGGTVVLSGLRPGRYQLDWWDTSTGKRVKEQRLVVGASASLPLPAFVGDIVATLRGTK